MKRLINSDDSLGAMISISTEEQSSRNNHVYSREFQSMLEGFDDEGVMEETAHFSEKKRRLSVTQVKALEKNFEVENKLEPERKVKLAQELSLQPRQVAVWFQNRRARWKTKQLERDYGTLKANYDALKLDYDTLHLDNEGLVKEIRELKAKLNGEDQEDKVVPNSEEKGIEQNEEEQALVNNQSFNNSSNGGDSDSSAILNEDNSISSSGILQSHQLLISSSSPSSISAFQYQVKMEEHNFFSGEEACNFFADEQPPTLQWYCNGDDQWN